jgi:DNA modification methylase
VVQIDSPSEIAASTTIRVKNDTNLGLLSSSSTFQIIPKAKSGRHRFDGVHGWLPYYAGFSADFVYSILSRLSLDANSLVFDPFTGCGTTNVVCKSVNVPSVGLELNPVAYVASNAKLAWNLEQSEIGSQLNKLDPSKLGDCNWIHAPSQRTGSNEAVDYLVAAGHEILQLHGSIRCFLLAVAIETLRKLSVGEESTNPTWPKLEPKSAKARTAYRIFSTIARDRVAQLEKHKSYASCRAEVSYADAVSFAPDFRADVVVTSPPYLNRLDYVMNFALENSYLLKLGFPVAMSIDELRGKMIGTVKIADVPRANPAWGSTSDRILEGIKRHPSRAAETYYLKTVLQYFDRLYKCICMVGRALKNNGICFMVVRSSYFKNMEVPLALIVEEMATNAGFKEISLLREDVVRSHLGRMDPDQRKWVNDKSLVENVMFMRR